MIYGVVLIAKYHINPETGRIGRCSASVRDCIFAVDGHVTQHYDSEEADRAAYEKTCSTSFGDTKSLRKPVMSDPKNTPDTILGRTAEFKRVDNIAYFKDGSSVPLRSYKKKDLDDVLKINLLLAKFKAYIFWMMTKKFSLKKFQVGM